LKKSDYQIINGIDDFRRLLVKVEICRHWRVVYVPRYVPTVMLLAEPAAVRQALIEQLVDLATRRLATLLADRPPHSGQQPQLGVDGLPVAHGAEA
jgi:hypothetical protein